MFHRGPGAAAALAMAMDLGHRGWKVSFRELVLGVHCGMTAVLEGTLTACCRRTAAPAEAALMLYLGWREAGVLMVGRVQGVGLAQKGAWHVKVREDPSPTEGSRMGEGQEVAWQVWEVLSQRTGRAGSRQVGMALGSTQEGAWVGAGSLQESGQTVQR